MTVTDIAIKAGSTTKFLKNLGTIFATPTKQWPTKVKQCPTRALELKAKFGSVDASVNPKTAFSLIPDVMKFYRTAQNSKPGIIL